jgi:Ca2+-binding RTX toxin-like protein
MGTITNTDFQAFNPALEDMLDATFVVGVADATTYEIVGSTSGYIFQLTGSDFSYSGTDPAGGSITGFNVLDLSGNLIVAATGLDRSLLDVLAGLTTSSTEALRILFGTDSHSFFGSDSDDDISTFDSTATVDGGGGDDMITGGTGNDILNGGDGLDDIDGGSGNDTVDGGDGDDDIYGGDGNDILAGGAGDDYVYGDEDDDTLNGGDGDDTLDGGAGNDILDGGAGADLLDGGDGDDQLFSLSGVECGCEMDVLFGGDGVDFAFVDRSDWTIALQLDLTDPYALISIADRIIISEIERIEFHAGSGNDMLTGGALDDALYGGAGRDLLDGGAGDDVLQGGAGIDTLDGDDGDDLLDGGSEADMIEGGAGNDTIFGGSGSDNLSGGSGNDLLDGGPSIDIMDGGDGDDTYVVDNIYDMLNEEDGAGTDLVISSVDFRLGAHFENLTLAGAAIIGIGNELGNLIVGNADQNQLLGLDGNDRLDGGAGADLMLGGRGDDFYIVDNAGDLAVEGSGEGFDRVMARVSYELLPESEIELLTTNGSIGTSRINLTGNSFYQEIIGNSGANILSSKGGGDLMRGLAGNDTYRVYDAADVVREDSPGGGIDHVAAAVDYALASGAYIEKLTTNGSTGLSNIDLTGNEKGQIIVGNAGANRLDGKAGNDTLTGLGGKDGFVFSTALGPDNVDTITDFNVADDTIRLDAAIFAAAGPIGRLAAAALLINDTGVATEAATRIVYDTLTGALFYDADGSGTDFAGIQFANLTPGLSLTNTDFVVF